MFEWVAQLPLDYYATNYYKPHEKLEDYTESNEHDDDDRKAKRQKIDECIKYNIEITQQEQQQYYIMLQCMKLLLQLLHSRRYSSQ